MARCLDLIDNCGLSFCNLLVPCFLGRRSQVLPPGNLLLLSWDHVFCLFHNPCPSHAMWNPRASPEPVDSSWKFPHQLFAPPPPGTGLLSTTSPRTLSLALGQAPGLFTTFYLRVGLCWALNSGNHLPSSAEQQESVSGRKEMEVQEAHLCPPRLRT